MNRLAEGIAWLGSSIAGLSALLYGAGFLALQSHSNLLGISGASFPASEYLKEGARFFLINLMMIPWDRPLLTLLLGSAVAAIALRVLVSHEAQKARGRWAWLTDRYALGAFFVLVAGLAVISFTRFPVFFLATSVNDLLLPPPESARFQSVPDAALEGTGPSFQPEASQSDVVGVLVSEIRSADERPRVARYEALLFDFTVTLALLGAVGFLCTRFSKGQASSLRSALRASLGVLLGAVAVIAFAELLLLPVNFGKLVSINEFPVVRVVVADASLREEVPHDRSFLMLLKSDREIVLYDFRNPVWKSIVVLSRGEASSIRVLGTEAAF
jgi:hypothetical protein